MGIPLFVMRRNGCWTPPPTLFNIYTSDLPPPSATVQVMAYADDITSTSASKNIYNHTYIKFLHGQNNLILNPDKTTCNSVHARPCRIYEKSGPQNTQHFTTHVNSPNCSGSYLRPKTHIQHTHLSPCTQTSTNHKNIHCNRMG